MPVPVRTSGQLGPVLKQLRKARHWSQSELGRRVGLSQERISAMENHPESVTFDKLLTIMMALDAEFMVSSDALPHTGAPAASDAPGKPVEPW